MDQPGNVACVLRLSEECVGEVIKTLATLSNLLLHLIHLKSAQHLMGWMCSGPCGQGDRIHGVLGYKGNKLSSKSDQQQKRKVGSGKRTDSGKEFNANKRSC